MGANDGFYKDMGLSFVMRRALDAPVETREQKLERELAQLRQTNEAQATELRRIGKNGHPTGIAVAVREDTVVIAVGSQFLEAQKPERLPGGKVVRPGDGVRVTQPQLQIVDVVDPLPFGTVHEVARLLPGGLCEVRMMPSSRAVLCPERYGVKEGDSVVVDATMITVLMNLGKKGENRYAVKGGTGVRWSDVVGQDDAVRAMREAVEEPVLFKDLYAEMGKKRSKGVLLWGPPGTGKTLLAKAAVTGIADLHSSAGSETSFAYIKGPELMNKYVGQSEENVRSIFSGAREHFLEHGQPQVVFIDEAESILTSRAKREGRSTVDVNVVQMFLAEMDGLADASAFFVLATNRPQDLDPAVVREGRVDTKIEMRRPTQQSAVGIASIHLSGAVLENGVALTAERVAEKMFSAKHVLGMVVDAEKKRSKVLLSHTASGAMVAGIVEAAKQVAIRRIKDGRGPRAISYEDVDEAVRGKYEEALGFDHREVATDVAGGPSKAVAFEPTRRGA
jgi:AAA+ superfamily predicted ATPase